MTDPLKSKEEILQMLPQLEWLDALPDLVRILSPQGQVLFENQAMVRFSQEMGKPENAVIPPLLDPAVFKEGRPSRTDFCTQRRVYSVSTSPVTISGKIIGAMQIFRDITLQNELTISLSESNRRLENDLRLARKIQTRMLPQKTRFGPLTFDYRYLPTEELSGDFFDILPVAQGKAGLYITDVVGHGVSASILTMFVRQTMRSILQEQKVIAPAQVLAKVLQKYLEIQISPQQYFTLFYALFDYEKETVTFANAGHNCLPLLKSHDHVEELEAKGMIISPLFQQGDYKETTLFFRPGSDLLFYTDGAVESQSPAQVPYGADRLKEFFEKTQKGFLDKFLAELAHYRQGRQEDDITLLLVHSGKGEEYEI